MTAKMFRIPVSVVHGIGSYSFVQDNGVMLPASVSSLNGFHIFSGIGPGLKGLALIGLWHEVLNWLIVHRDGGIDNQIVELPEIYMGVSFYKPGDRFVGCFPIGDAIKLLSSSALDLVPGGTVGDIGSVVATVVDKAIGRKSKETSKDSLVNTEAMVTFHYLPGNGMTKVGSGQLRYHVVYEQVLKMLSNLT